MHKVNIENPKSVKLNTANTSRLYDLVGRPLDNIPVIHVGGTNGKGSVCYKVSKALQASGLSTGLFVSPHISSFRERIQVNDKLINIETMSQILTDLFILCDKEDINASFFELITILSMLYFERMGADVVVMEVGIGGRRDSTNVISKTALSVLTSVQKDHELILGNTLSAIAAEKAGIMKKDCPVLVAFGSKLNTAEQSEHHGGRCGAPGLFEQTLWDEAELQHHSINEETQEDQSVIKILHDTSMSVGVSSLQHLNEVLDTKELRKLALATTNIDELNTSISKAVLKCLVKETPKPWWTHTYSQRMSKLQHCLQSANANSLQEALNEQAPCRFQVIETEKVTVILDVAHNEPAIRALCSRVRALRDQSNRFGDIYIVTGMQRTKDVAACIQHMVNLVGIEQAGKRIRCIPTLSSKSLPVNELRSILVDIAGIITDDLVESASIEEKPGAQSTDRLQEYAYLNKAIMSNMQQVIDFAISENKYDKTPLILICGSTHIMSAARSLLSQDYEFEPADAMFS